MTYPPFVQGLLSPWMNLAASNPLMLAMQIGLLLGALLLIFLLFYATRDILLRTRSFWYMLLCIVLVAAFPVFGFLLYILIRPSLTLHQRAQDELLHALLAQVQSVSPSQSTPAVSAPTDTETAKQKTPRKNLAKNSESA